MHTPASVSYYASRISGRSWSISAHAKDIWTIEAWELREKLASADWLVTCTAANHAYLSDLGEPRDKVSLLYHGLDFVRFPSPPEQSSMRDGSAEAVGVWERGSMRVIRAGGARVEELSMVTVSW